MKRLFLSLLILASCGPSVPQLPQTPATENMQQAAAAAGVQFFPLSQRERSFLQAARSSAIASTVLMKEEDRVAAAFWIDTETPDQMMNALTEIAFQAFSPSMKNLVDDTLIREGYHPIDVLAFSDPSISDERMMIVRIGGALFEFHYAETWEPLVQGMLLELARLE